MQKIVVLGATSAIAQAVERLCARNRMELLLVARSLDRLDALKGDLLARGARSVSTFAADLVDISGHADVLRAANNRLTGFDTVLLAYGTLLDQEQCRHSAEMVIREIHTNFTSAASLLTMFAEHFEQARVPGTLAAITSVAGDRGRKPNYVYGSAKGGLSLFLQGLRSRLRPAGVNVLTIKPGPVDTPMIANHPNPKLRKMAASAEKVGADIYRALQDGTSGVLYTPGKWRYIMGVVRAIPERWAMRMGM